MPRITPVALLLSALLLMASPVLADSEHNQDKKADKQAEREARDGEAEPQAEPDQTTESERTGNNYDEQFDVGGGGCEPVGVQLTPPPPRPGIDPACLLDGIRTPSQLGGLLRSIG